MAWSRPAASVRRSPAAACASGVLVALLFALSAAQAVTPSVSAQRDHALALARDGRVLAWGWDTQGQLGLGRALYKASPHVVAGLPVVVHASAGDYHAAAVDAAGNVWTWGSDTFGALGERSPARPTVPGRVTGITGVTKVVATESFTAALRSDGTVWAWGTHVGERVPTRIAGLSGITAIRGGAEHLVALAANGTVWTVGVNTYGQLGNGGFQATAQPAQQVAGLANITKIGAGRYASLALRNDGTVFNWGSNLSWSTATAHTTPTAVPGITGTVADVVGGYYSYALRATGTVVRWDDTFAPLTPAGFEYTGVTQFVATLDEGSAALLTNGTVAMNGRNWEGQRGLGHTAQDPPYGTTITAVPGLSGVALVSQGFWYTLALTNTGALYAWGSNFEGQQALGDERVVAVPTQVPGLPAIQKIAAGITASWALDGNGNVWVWGSNLAFQLGDGTRTARPSPGLLAGISGVTDIAAGCNFGLFRKSDGTVHVAGYLGGTGGSVPTQVAGLSNIVAIAAGCVNAFAIDSGGAVHSWGSGAKGLIGDGQTITRNTPVTLTAFDSPVTAISVGDYHGLARTADGGVWSWGQNWSGQLGDGGPYTEQRATPARVAGVGAATAVAASTSHSLVRLATGQLSAWGRWGLGDGSTAARFVPGAVPTLTGIQAIGAGNGASWAIDNGGILYGWGGTNQFGGFPSATVGDGTFAFRGRPVFVLREGAAGNLDAGDWYLDLDATVSSTPIASLLPRIVPVAGGSLSGGGITLAAGINFRAADYGKTVGTYVLGYVPPAFLTLVKTAPGLDKARLEALLKDGEPILVQLTPEGWATVTGQLIAFTSGVVAGNGGAGQILNGIPPTAIPGAVFCIGYGESGGDMLSAGTLREVLSLDGAASSVGGAPCVLAGVYVGGPATSRQGTTATFSATVVGVSPTGSVQFRDGLADLGAPVATVLANEAVANATLGTAALAVGAHSIGAAYAGDAQNAPRPSAIPLVHTVSAAASPTTVTLAAPVSSTAGDPVTLVATVAGSSPTGSVQFRDGATVLGAAVPLVGGAASLTVSTLALGAHTITGQYGGDAANAGATSAGLVHTVYAALVPAVDLVSAANPVAFGGTVNLTATVTGTSPTGTVTFRKGGAALSTVTLSGGVATLSVGGLAAGTYVFTADYNGDADDPPASSPALFQGVNPPVPDSVPDAFAFADVSGVAWEATVVSAPVTITGINVPAPVSVSGGTYAIGCTGPYTATAGTVANGQTVCVSHVASAVAGGTASTTLTVGGVSDTFTSTALALDPAGDQDGDGIPNRVELREGRDLYVKDNDVFGNARLFTMQQYRDFLGREGDEAGIAGWAAAVGAGAWTRAQVIDGFVGSAEFGGFVAPVVRLYFATFLRIPDYAGLTYNASLVRAGTVTPAQLADFFAASPEFQATYGTLDDTQYVTLLYANVLGRAPDPAGLAGWVGYLAGGISRGQVLLGFSDSPEYQAAMANEVLVTMMYVGMLRRSPEPAGFAGWLQWLDSGGGTRTLLIDGFFGSAEYRARFLP